jgi:ABC-type oligopeptide transport system substrate-binding subunit
MTVDIWIRDYNPPMCFQQKISGSGSHNGGLIVKNSDSVFGGNLLIVLTSQPNSITVINISS